MFEDGHWLQGRQHAQQWQDVHVRNGVAVGAGISTNAYDDCVACRDNFNNNKHTAIGTVFRDAGYAPSGNHEIEIIVGANIGPRSVRLYEFLWAVSGNFQVVRWNGSMGSFKFDLPTTGAVAGVPQNGDVIEVRYDATNANEVVLTCLINGRVVANVRDSTPERILSGNPGISFFGRSGADMTRFGFARWQCFAS